MSCEKYGKDMVVQIVTFGTHGCARRYPRCGACDGSAVRFLVDTIAKNDSKRTEYHHR